jgi:hypothetical protein
MRNEDGNEEHDLFQNYSNMDLPKMKLKINKLKRKKIYKKSAEINSTKFFKSSDAYSNLINKNRERIYKKLSLLSKKKKLSKQQMMNSFIKNMNLIDIHKIEQNKDKIIIEEDFL